MWHNGFSFAVEIAGAPFAVMNVANDDARFSLVAFDGMGDIVVVFAAIRGLP